MISDTAICIASGPSLTKEDVEYCRGKGRVYVVKECRVLAPWADVLYAADTDWWELNKGAPDFAGDKWTVSEEAAKKYGLSHIVYDTELLWSNKPGLIATGGNSGFQAVNLAVLQGAKRVILLGFDMGYDRRKQDKHWWEKQIDRKSRPSNYEMWIAHFNKASKIIPVPVFNASRLSALECFPRVTVHDVL